MEVNGEHTVPKQLGRPLKNADNVHEGKVSSILAPLIKIANGCGFVGVVLLIFTRRLVMKVAGKKFSCLKGIVAASHPHIQKKEDSMKISADYYQYKRVEGNFPCPKCGAEMVWEGREQQPEEKIDLYSHGTEKFRCTCGNSEFCKVWDRIEVEGIHYKGVSCRGCGRKGRASVQSSGPHYCGACAMRNYLSNPKY